MHENPLILISLCTLFLAIIENHLANKRGLKVYSKAQTEHAIGLMIGQLIINLSVFAFLHKLIAIPESSKPILLPAGFAWAFLAFLSLDFLAYLNHFFSHKVDLFWTDHAVHHANTEFNLLTHLTHGWTGFISATLVISALTGLVGNMRHVLLAYFAAATLVQTLAHTQLIYKLGFLEIFLITPSHHRVHHAIERSTHDSNYGIVFIIWDKLFGTFKAEDFAQQTQFGLTYSPRLDASLWQHAMFGWVDFFKKLRYSYANRT